MKKPEWLFVGALLLVSAYFTYRYFSKTEEFNPLALVPKTSVAVYETKDILGAYSSLRESVYWKDIEKISAISSAGEIITVLDSIIIKKRALGNVLKSNPTLISLHVTGNESSGLMFYLPTGMGSKAFLEEVLQKYTGSAVEYKSRIYDGLSIHELVAGEHQLIFINHKDYVILSTVGYLVEDVVRNLNNDLTDNFLINNSNLTKVPKLDDDAGNLYLNGLQLSAFYNTLLPALNPHDGELAKSVFMDLSLSKQGFLMSGFLFEDKQSDFATIFEDQEAGSPATLRLVPDNAAQVMSINISDVKSWYSKWINKFDVGTTNGSQPKAQKDNFINNILGDITLITFNSNNKEKQEKLLLVKLADKEGMMNVLNKQAEDIVSKNQDTVYFEQFAGHKIGLIEQDEFVKGILGKPFAGFASTYFMLYDDYLVLSTSSEQIKKWLTDIENDMVWGRSVRRRSFIDDSMGETSFALIFNNPWSWSLALEGLNLKHQQWWQENEQPLKQFGLASFQFTNLDNRFYTEVNLIYQPQQVETGRQQLNDISLSLLSNNLIRKPKLVKNHKNNLWEVFLQDSTNKISLLDDKGEILWQEVFPDAITSNIYQLDFYKNRKLQYLFATDSAIYIVDRNGSNIGGFPIHFSEFQVKQLYLIDYDHSKNYRILISDNSGNLRMFNKQMKQLDGWNPLPFNSTLSDQIFHVRVRGKDRIVVAQQNGNVDLRNRRGEAQPGFPVDLEFNIINPIHFAVGSTFESARFTTISKEGMLVKFDLNGKLYAQRQLDQKTSSSVFTLIKDGVQNDYVIARQNLNRLAILNKGGEVIFEKDYQSNSKKEVQYYSLGVDKQLYIIRDVETGKLYLYNKSGTLINTENLFSDYPISVIYRKSQSMCYIYTSVAQSVEVNYFSF
ncbi:MAG: hypothetical protein DRI71_06270 [Bacteroidetes bacterium]|nr:MAG: hypothetical protein DRI71_06270 [Bacteroidota bacterium]